MRRYSWIFTILVIAAIFWWKHGGSVPSIPYPNNAIPRADGIHVPIVMQLPQDSSEFWTLAQTANHQYVVNTYNRQAVVAKFPATSEVSHTTDGTTYATAGHIRMGLEEYAATEIHINTDGKSGYILFQPVNTSGVNNAVTGNSSQSNAATNSQ